MGSHAGASSRRRGRSSDGTMARPRTERSGRPPRQPKPAPRDKPRAGRDGQADVWRGLRRALTVLEHLAISPGRAVDVTREMGLPWATAYRTLSQLEDAGFLKRDKDTNRYEIGHRMWFIGTAYVANHRVLRTAMPYLYQAERIEGVAVQLAERSGRQSVNIFSAQPLAGEITKATYGYHFPLHCGSKGWVLLAYADPAFIEDYLSGPLERLTADTITDAARLRAELAKVRQREWAMTLGDVQTFTGSIAAPIHDQTGRAVASLTFVSKKAVIADDKRREALLEILLHAARSTSFDLGWRPGLDSR